MTSGQNDWFLLGLLALTACSGVAPSDDEALAKLEGALSPAAAAASLAAAACTGLTLTRFPLDGTNGVDWLIHNYTDQDPSAGGLRDFMGQTGAAARTIDGHLGADVAVSSFRKMDDGSALIRAAAPGVVIGVVQNNPDRSTTCTPTSINNYIAIDHGNGFVGSYLHIKKNSSRVQVGARVSAGTVLAVVGSAGCSTGPHLHFQLDCNGVALESFSPNLWSSPPAFRPTSQVMDVSIRAGGEPTFAQIEDPGADATVLPPNAPFGVGVMAGTGPNDAIHVRVRRPNGSLFASADRIVHPSRYGLDYEAFGWTLGGDGGEWKVEVQVNNGRTVTKRFKTSQTTLVGVAESSFQSQFDDLVTKGYRPVWEDTFNVGSTYYYNAVFRLSDGTAWYSKGALTNQQLATEFTNLPAGYRPIVLEAYPRGTAINYNVVFAQQGGAAWTYYFGQPDAQAQTLFNQFTGSGYRQLTSSVAIVNGVRYSTGLYDKSNGGGWVSYSALDYPSYATLFNQQIALGRHQSYLDIDSTNGTLQYSVIFDSRSVGAWETWNGLNGSAFGVQLLASEGGGEPTRLVRGYSVANNSTFGGIWSQFP